MRTVFLLGFLSIADAISKLHGSVVPYNNATLVFFSTVLVVAVAMDILEFIRDL